MLYGWTVSLPGEAKISQAYQMLKSQGETRTSQAWNFILKVSLKKILCCHVSFQDVLSADPEISLDADASLPSPRQQSPVIGDEKKNKVRALMGLLTDALSWSFITRLFLAPSLARAELEGDFLVRPTVFEPGQSLFSLCYICGWCHAVLQPPQKVLEDFLLWFQSILKRFIGEYFCFFLLNILQRLIIKDWFMTLS